ncbi:hypothetical protein JDN40_03900 [Rhodomicrobium vannielii ATCC 17100]|uniref:hypothetical protein n=1 Tax=Rhodomicrobium vannielii TaxID=1069 RepID=UPI00191AC001|nr:hypothetical protein [Rhodomicrobium vannielii]MBJ7533249.1 hypothetical protein [Rhodomicrobium vannielii ATCC 17100]
MQKPLDLGGKIIDAANIHTVKPLSGERIAGLNSHKNFTAEIRAIGGGGFVEKLSVSDIVEGLAKIGENLTLLPTGEAIRSAWVISVKEFASRPDAPNNKYASVVELRNPTTGDKVQEWLTARPTQILGSKPLSLNDLGGGPGG